MFRTLTVFSLVVALVIQGHGGQANVIASRQFGEAPDHPLVGSWMLRRAPAIAGEPWILVPAEFRADGSVVFMFPVSQDRDGELMITTMAIGTWRPTGPREARFTAIHSNFDANGIFRGTVRIEGFPVVSASGQSFIDNGVGAVITERDAAGFVVLDTDPSESRSPMMATRILPGTPVDEGPCGPLLSFCE